MKIKEFKAGVKTLDLSPHADERGCLTEDYRIDEWAEYLDGAVFVQSNLTLSRKGVLRGMHMQLHEPQGKLIQCLGGSIFDVVVDMRVDSPTLGLSQTFELDAMTRRQLWIPPGFAHGFLSLEDDTLVHYRMTSYYHPQSSITLRWDAPEIKVEWPVEVIGGMEGLVMSAKDKEGMEYADIITMLKGDASPRGDENDSFET